MYVRAAHLRSTLLEQSERAVAELLSNKCENFFDYVLVKVFAFIWNARWNKVKQQTQNERNRNQ